MYIQLLIFNHPYNILYAIIKTFGSALLIFKALRNKKLGLFNYSGICQPLIFQQNHRKIIVVKLLCLYNQTSFQKKGKLNFEGGIFSPFWDNIQNAALRDGKHAQLPRTADRAP